MNFKPTISKEKIRELPLLVFEGTIHIIDTPEKVKNAILQLSREKQLGFDTETKPVFKKGITHKIALVQLSTETDAYLFRLNKIGFPSEIIDLFTDEPIQKIGADINLDLRGLKKIKSFSPTGFIDIQKIATKTGIENLSLRNLTGIVLNQRLSKRQQLSNWEREELSPGQQNYAATDAYVCLKIFNALNQHTNE